MSKSKRGEEELDAAILGGALRAVHHHRAVLAVAGDLEATRIDAVLDQCAAQAGGAVDGEHHVVAELGLGADHGRVVGVAHHLHLKLARSRGVQDAGKLAQHRGGAGLQLVASQVEGEVALEAQHARLRVELEDVGIRLRQLDQRARDIRRQRIHVQAGHLALQLVILLHPLVQVDAAARELLLQLLEVGHRRGQLGAQAVLVRASVGQLVLRRSHCCSCPCTPSSGRCLLSQECSPS